MNRVPAPPAKNLPQAIIDLADILKNPEWLDNVRKTAQEVSEANKLTEEDITALEAAKKTLSDADEVNGKIKQVQAELVKAQEDLDTQKDLTAKREKQCDARTTQLSKDEGDLRDRKAFFEKSLAELKMAQANLAKDQEALEHNRKVQQRKEQELVERENVLKRTAGALGGKA